MTPTRLMLVNNRGDATDLKIFHVSMDSKNGATALTVTDLSINGRQAMGDPSGQSDHECMAFRGRTYREVAGEVESNCNETAWGSLGKGSLGNTVLGGQGQSFIALPPAF